MPSKGSKIIINAKLGKVTVEDQISELTDDQAVRFKFKLAQLNGLVDDVRTKKITALAYAKETSG